MRLRFLEIATLSMLVIEMCLTFPLWGVSHTYPRIPFWGVLADSPVWLEYPGLACVIFAAVLIALSWVFSSWGERLLIDKKNSRPVPNDRHDSTAGTETDCRTAKFARFCCDVGHLVASVGRSGQRAWLLLGFGLVWFVLFDQHRFQTWVWQAILYAFCLGIMNRDQSLKWIQRLTIGIYFFSAISKFDASFANSYGQTILDGLLQALHLHPDWPAAVRWWIVLGFPLFELLVAILLIVPRLRLIGLLFSYFMHFALLLALGPWGLNHRPPVLIWNLFFLLQNSILFWPDRGGKQEQTGEVRSEEVTKQWPAYVASLLLLFPATEWFDICDIWPGWGLYAAHGARVTFSIDQAEVDKLPQSLQHLLAPPVFEHSWRKLDCHQFSFEQTNSPSYPEDRTQFAVAIALIERFGLRKTKVTHYGTADRWTGKRKVTELTTPEELSGFSERFRLNVRARRDAWSDR